MKAWDALRLFINLQVVYFGGEFLPSAPDG